MGKYIGVDLGTTFSCMAYIDNQGQPVVIPNSEGEHTTPSAVLFEDDTVIVGNEAKNQSILEPSNYEQFVKRHMGERGYQFITKEGVKYTPESISAIILAKLKKDAEAYLGDSVDGAVVTVPAYFTEAQRKATLDAGELAGLNVVALINEPTAAAIAFGVSKAGNQKQTVMVYDLGGGTFDVTILRFEDDSITVLSTTGDRELGGYDFDARIIKEVIECAADTGINIADDPTARQDLQLKAEEAKKALSSKEKTNIILNVAGHPYKYMLTRDDFVDLVEPLLFQTVSCMETACEDAGLEYSDLDKILLVGGSTRMPLIRDSITEETGIVPSSEVHPDEAVAVGAAYHVLEVVRAAQAKHAASAQSSNADEFKVSESANDSYGKMQHAVVPEVARQYGFTDVTSHGIGVVMVNDAGERVNSVILPKNSQVPASCTQRYTTTVEYQEALKIEVTQGEIDDIRYVTIVGESLIEVEPRDHIFEIDVTISCDENSIIHVRVFDVDYQRDLGEMRIDRVSNLSDAEKRESRQRISMLDISGD